MTNVLIRGKVCLPVAEQCAIRKEKVPHNIPPKNIFRCLNLFDNLTFIPQIGATPFQNKTYWFNWQSNEQVALILCLIDIFFWESLETSGRMLGIFSKVTGKIWRCTGYMLQRNDFSKS